MADPDAEGLASSPAGLRPGHVIESPRPLSASSLWDVQRAYYDASGVRAWSSGDVPHLLTSGPIIARTYAALIEALAADLRAGRGGPFDPDEPLVIVELGSGTGRLGFLLSRALARRDLGAFRPLVVVTDTVEANLQFMLGHERLAPLLAGGRLDVARYDAGAPAELWLRHAGRPLAAPLANPVVLVANYFFDVLPQDLYALRNGELVEQLVALCATEPGFDPTDPSLFNRVFLATVDAALRAPEDPEDAELLEARRAEAAEHERFLFPPLALATLRAFGELAGGRVLALVGERPGRLGPLSEEPSVAPEGGAGGPAEDGADDGAKDPEDRRGAPIVLRSGSLAHSPGALLAMGIHGGSMSLPLDLDVIADFAHRRGGELLVPESLSSALSVGCLVLGLGDATGLRHAYRVVDGEASPEDLYLTIKAATDRKAGASLPMLLGALRLGGYDPYLARQCYPLFEAMLPEADAVLGAEAARVLVAVVENDYPLGGEPELALGIAALLAPLGRYELAKALIESALLRRPQDPVALYNLALCDLHLEDPVAALAALEDALSADPGYAAAAKLRDLVAEEIARRSSG